MKANTIKLRRKAGSQFKAIAEQMVSEGADVNQVLVTFDNFAKLKSRQFYKKGANISTLGSVIASILTKPKADSKAELIFIDILNDNNIKYKFQYKIGPYKADFLLGESLVCELDGPHHTQPEQKAHDLKRDKYLRKMGYKVLRIPLIVLTLDQRAVIEEIKEILNL